jgi:hypothetical protein
VPIDPFWLVPAALALDAVIGAADRSGDIGRIR